MNASPNEQSTFLHNCAGFQLSRFIAHSPHTGDEAGNKLVAFDAGVEVSKNTTRAEDETYDLCHFWPQSPEQAIQNRKETALRLMNIAGEMMTSEKISDD